MRASLSDDHKKPTNLFARHFQRKRNRAKEIAEKLETVTDLTNAITVHLVPPERTFKARNMR
ncbi:TPA: hypothetical protein I7785_20960 [Vibrio vulnificus]|nr:hypothetical protein [Vibrio vulnificus]